MNWLLLVVVGLILFCAIRGWRRGLLRILYSPDICNIADWSDFLCYAIYQQLY